MPSTTPSPETEQNRKAAALAARIILGFYPSVDAADEEVFVAGFVALLASFPAYMSEIASSPVTGIPAEMKFLPRIAEAKDWLEKRFDAEERHRELLSRPKALPSPEAPARRPMPGAATVSGLCAKYGIRALPGGWDAVETARQHARLGEGFRAHVERLLAEEDEKAGREAAE